MSVPSSAAPGSAWEAAKAGTAPPPALRLLAGLTGETPSDESYFAPRVPIKPVRIATILATWEALDGAN